MIDFSFELPLQQWLENLPAHNRDELWYMIRDDDPSPYALWSLLDVLDVIVRYRGGLSSGYQVCSLLDSLASVCDSCDGYV